MRPTTDTGWQKVIFAADCDGEGNCPVCGVDYADCPCIGPTEDDVEYEERADGLYARRREDRMTKRGLIAMLESAPDDLELLVRDNPIADTWSEAAVVYEHSVRGARMYFYPPAAAPPPDIE